jgi:diaminopimelate epimerase
MGDRVPFTKAHALGNDFLLVHSVELGSHDPGRFAIQICDRHSGVGADGLVTLAPAADADAIFRIYNSDGSEAALSGNALRCAAAWLAAKKEFPPRKVTLATRLGVRELYFLEHRGNHWLFRAVIGKPAFGAADVPFRPPARSVPLREPIVGFPLPVGDTTIPATILAMGNPQCIILVEDWSLVDWRGIGTEVERHPYFPDRVNVGFVRVVAEDRVEARFWERGAGHTLASGTGSCACVVAAHLAGKTLRRVAVVLERGEMEVHWRDDGVAELTGPAAIVAEGDFLL